MRIKYFKHLFFMEHTEIFVAEDNDTLAPIKDRTYVFN